MTKRLLTTADLYPGGQVLLNVDQTGFGAIKHWRGVLRTRRGRIVVWACQDPSGHLSLAEAKACATRQFDTLTAS